MWFAIILLAFFLLILIWIVPEWQVRALKESTEPAKLVSLKNELRKTLAQIMGGILILASLYGTWKTIEFSKEAADKNLRVATEGQITERFTRAVEQLGNAKLEIRLGGIYALERISKDSLKDYGQIMEVFTAFVRERSPRNLEQKSKGEEKLSTDVQAILSIIGRRILNYKKKEEQPLDLNNTYLYMARLEGFDLEGFNLRGANLKKANLRDTKLTGADLTGADLTGADLTGANLERVILETAFLLGANLTGAKLMGANLTEANLERAELVATNLQVARLEKGNLLGAYLNDADLTGANLRSANLKGADLEEANLETAFLLGANLTKANLKGARLMGANLTEANLTEANLEGAELAGTNLERSHLEGANLKGLTLYRSNLRNANLKGADLEEAYLYSADLREVKNLTIEQLSNVKTLYLAEFDQNFMEQIKGKYPHLLERPAEEK